LWPPTNQAAGRLLDESTVKPEIQSALDKFLPSLTVRGDAGRDRQVFQEATCSKCQQLDDVGRHVAIDLSRITDRSPRSLLVHTSDPNRLVDHRYLGYSVATDDGLQIVGMMLDEATDSITLADLQGEQQVVLRKKIDELVCNNRSLMPEGLEGNLTLQWVFPCPPKARPLFISTCR
jgi:putative heme-binding domain-containing protein